MPPSPHPALSDRGYQSTAATVATNMACDQTIVGHHGEHLGRVVTNSRPRPTWPECNNPSLQDHQGGSTRILYQVRIIEFGPEQGKAITHFDSNGLHATAVIRSDAVNVTVLHVAAGGEIGRHRATVDQLFMVVSGSGHVCGANECWQPISAGQAAIWHSGEHHTTRAEEQMTVVVIEMESLPVVRQ